MNTALLCSLYSIRYFCCQKWQCIILSSLFCWTYNLLKISVLFFLAFSLLKFQEVLYFFECCSHPKANVGLVWCMFCLFRELLLIRMIASGFEVLVMALLVWKNPCKSPALFFLYHESKISNNVLNILWNYLGSIKLRWNLPSTQTLKSF